MTTCSKIALLGILAGGCAPPMEGGGALVGDVLLDPPHRPGRPLSQALGPNGHHIIFCNFEGVTLAPTYDDAVHDKSSIAASAGHSIVVPPFNGGDLTNQLTRDQVISDVMNLTRKFYADFNVDLVTQRPVAGDYVMTAIGGDPSLINMPCNVNGCIAGVAPLDCGVDGNGNILYNPSGDIEVVYAFSATAKGFGGSYATKLLNLATTIAQETAHAYGLGHTSNPQDIMYPQTSGQTVGFKSGPYADSFNCANGVGMQDSYGVLLQVLGPTMAPVDRTPPTVAISAPQNGAALPRSFTVTVTATDDTSVDHVDLQLSGSGPAINQRLGAAPYTASVTVPTDGIWAISATAFDPAGNMALATVTVSVKSDSKLPFGAPCTSAAACASGLCSGAICTMSCGTCPTGFSCSAQMVCEKAKAPPMPGAVGAMCTDNSKCTGMLCAELGGQRFCTAPCTVGDPSGCPDGMVCSSFGADGTLCAFPTGRGASGCSTSVAAPGAHTGWLGLLGWLALCALARRRRCSPG